MYVNKTESETIEFSARIKKRNEEKEKQKKTQSEEHSKSIAKRKKIIYAHFIHLK